MCVLDAGIGEKMSSQDEVIYRLKQKVVSLEEERDRAIDQVEELRSENEKLRHLLQDVMKKEGRSIPLISYIAQLFICHNH